MTTVTQQLITGVDFVGIPARDLDVCVTFYGDTLGLRRSVYMPERNFAEFETGNLTLNLMNAEKMGLPHVTFTNPLALHVGDVAAVRSTLEAKGVTFHGDTIDP